MCIYIHTHTQDYTSLSHAIRTSSRPTAKKAPRGTSHRKNMEEEHFRFFGVAIMGVRALIQGQGFWNSGFMAAGFQIYGFTDVI